MKNSTYNPLSDAERYVIEHRGTEPPFVGEYDDFYETFESSSDYFIVEIDSENKRETSYGFAVNISGVKSDYMIYSNDSSSIDDYWNTNWEVEVSYKENFWVAEIKIPVSSLRFDNLSELDWGINFIRYSKYNNETVLWSVNSKMTEKILSQYGKLKNLISKVIGKSILQHLLGNFIAIDFL